MELPVVAAKLPFVMELEPGTYYWCACGLSKTQPFCDGSHKVTSFRPIEWTISERKKVAFCGCKRSQRKPLCDGSHRDI